MDKPYYYLGQVRIWSITYDVYRVFGVTIMREHYQPISWMTGKPLKRMEVEVEAGSMAMQIIDMRFSEPKDIFEMLDNITVLNAANEPLGAYHG